MAVPKDTEWALDDHSRGKHAVLQEYLKAWLPIMSQSEKRIIFIDGFAGPGGYTGGEDGSPIIALKALRDHRGKDRFQQVNFLFVEEREDRARRLRERVDAIRDTLPASTVIRVADSPFSTELTTLLDDLDAADQRLAPSLMMVDPFGVKDVPLDLLKRFLVGKKKELFISFMCNAMVRHAEKREYEKHVTAMFGGETWHEAAREPDRSAALHALYARQLRAIGGAYVLRFTVKSGGKHIYTLFFVTKNPKGCDVMKRAMWKVAPMGDYMFNGAELGQGKLEFFDTTSMQLGQLLLDHYSDGVEVPYPVVQQFLESDQTLFHTGQLVTALRELESGGHIDVIRTPGQRAGTFKDTKITFLRG